MRARFRINAQAKVLLLIAVLSAPAGFGAFRTAFAISEAVTPAGDRAPRAGHPSSSRKHTIIREIQQIPRDRMERWRREQTRGNIRIRFRRWLAGLLYRWMQTGQPGIRWGFRALGWAALAALVVLVAFAAVRWVRFRRPRKPIRGPKPRPLPAPASPNAFLEKAGRLAARGDKHEALHWLFKAARQSVLNLFPRPPQEATARELSRMMEQRGVEPEIVQAWNTLIRPYESTRFGHHPLDEGLWPNLWRTGRFVIARLGSYRS